MLLIYTPYISNRLKYVFEHIFGQQLGIAYRLTSDLTAFVNDEAAARICYDTEKKPESLFFFKYPLLDEKKIEKIPVYEEISNAVPVLFKHHANDAALNFDVFSAVFYVLSRYEEYVYDKKDVYGNFDYRQSILFRLNALHTPLVDEWINMLRKVLIAHFPQLLFKVHRPRFAFSFDIDVAFEYRNRSLYRTIGGIAKKIAGLNFGALRDQLLTLSHLKSDAFDTYAYIFEKIGDHQALFFFNMGDYGKFDKNPSYKNKKFCDTIRGIDKKHITGLHPSYASNENDRLLMIEKTRLEEITGHKISLSRQHYLQLRIPLTYRNLLQAGIDKDFTMGYYLWDGFRGGTCHPFFFFDLERNETTELELYPFVFMDGTLNEVFKLTTKDATLRICRLINTVFQFNGVFIPLWHNSTLSNKAEWKGWRSVFETMVKEIESRKFEQLTDLT